jgi:hypothetical protein
MTRSLPRKASSREAGGGARATGIEGGAHGGELRVAPQLVDPMRERERHLEGEAVSLAGLCFACFLDPRVRLLEEATSKDHGLGGDVTPGR